MNYQDIMEALLGSQAGQIAGMKRMPTVQGYAEYMPERFRPQNAPVGSRMSPDQQQGMQAWQMFMQDPLLRKILLEALFRGTPGGIQ